VVGEADSQEVKVFTYYDRPGKSVELDRIVALWARSWSEQGWKPVVLDEETAKLHADYPTLLRRIPHLPTVNAIDYETACYVRWLALAQAGGGLMVDFDVLNKGFPPDHLHPGSRHLLVLGADRIPCAVYATPEGVKEITRWFLQPNLLRKALTKIDGRDHCSDMTFFQACYKGELFERCEQPDVRPDFPLWHVCTQYVGPVRSKYEVMEFCYRELWTTPTSS
jgi:hypothetical protein